MTDGEREALRLHWLWLGLGWLQVAVVIALGLAPSSELPTSTFQLNDKLVHFIQYFVLMLWFAGMTPVSRYWRIAVALALLGGAIEVLQGFTETRSTEVGDMLANLSGIAAAWLVARLLTGRWCHQVERWLPIR